MHHFITISYFIFVVHSSYEPRVAIVVKALSGLNEGSCIYVGFVMGRL